MSTVDYPISSAVSTTVASTQVTFPSLTAGASGGSFYDLVTTDNTMPGTFDSATLMSGIAQLPNRLDEELDTYLCGLGRKELVELIGAIREINDKLNPIFLKMAEDPAFAYSFTLLRDLQKRNLVIIDKATGVLEKLLRCALTA